MRTVNLLIDVPGKTAEEVYAALADLARYPDLADAVKSVVVTSIGDDVTRSQWEVAFRSGLLRWTEEDRFDRAALRIDFHQTEGDVAVFDGSWRCAATDAGARISFSARLDMGIPSLADALEPIAARTLVENTVAIVGGLVGETVLVDSRVAAVDPADPQPAGAVR
jgi:ribosome-associated toxin RatA of RatAB toxin-antitoxin module